MPLFNGHLIDRRSRNAASINMRKWLAVSCFASWMHCYSECSVRFMFLILLIINWKSQRIYSKDFNRFVRVRETAFFIIHRFFRLEFSEFSIVELFNRCRRDCGQFDVFFHWRYFLALFWRFFGVSLKNRYELLEKFYGIRIIQII